MSSDTGMASEQLIQRFMHAIALAEGSGVSGAVPTRANNPGNLTDDGDVGLGTIQTSGPFGAKITIYPTLEAGEKALHVKVARMLNGHSHTYPLEFTIAEVGRTWAGAPEWAQNVAKDLGVSVDTQLISLVDIDPNP
jgi:hypothetical protein